MQVIKKKQKKQKKEMLICYLHRITSRIGISRDETFKQRKSLVCHPYS